MSRAAESRVVSRAVAAVACLLLGAMAWTRLDLTYLPVWTFPELGRDSSTLRAVTWYLSRRRFEPWAKCAVTPAR